MTVLVTGGLGYIGWPTALALASGSDERVVAADAGLRESWSNAVGGVNVSPGGGPGPDNLDAVDADLADRDQVDRLIRAYEPRTVVHCASQPSAPYSQLDGRRALETQVNNVSMSVNLLWGLRECGLGGAHFIETTTTGLYGAPPFKIPEGGLEPDRFAGLEDGAGCMEIWEHLSGEDRSVPFPNMGGSWYHVTKGFDAANMRLAHKQWGADVSDVRTAIVYGAGTPETEEAGSPPRLDIDFYFGTVVHRFCAQAIAGYPITVYGKGEQRKPFIGLADAVAGLVELVDRGEPDGSATYNQVSRAISISIVEIAETVAAAATEAGHETEVIHVENPREEDEEHQMRIENDRYADLVGGSFEPFEDGVRGIIEAMSGQEDSIRAATDRFLPESLREGGD